MKSEIEQIERNALRLQSILNVLKTSALEHEGQSKNCEVSEFLGDLVNLCEIAKECADSVFKSASFIDSKLNEKQWIN